ncbi:MAG: UDP-N-acetylmuramoyl-tripeptide--D-alanyl-D-alanine ligase [PVC group bacterium]|nr:UDP-N-acetylmuramoyl-tripeptide--D-alanyl-D-alanine ligase [PVC group bacterium]
MFKLQKIIKAIQGNFIGVEISGLIKGVSIDSRRISSGELFIAIKGERFDGHDFVDSVLSCDAAGVIVSADWYSAHKYELMGVHKPVIVVDDPVKALANLAVSYRKRFNIPVIGVTGSNGKTTTKEMIAGVLSARYNVLKSKGSFNNHIGVPLSILKLSSEHQAAVFELGMNHPGEIRVLSDIILPKIAVITNTAEAHMGFFDSLSDISAAKCELLENLRNDDVAVINADCEELYSQAKKYKSKIISFGIERTAQYQASDIVSKDDGIEFIVNKKYEFCLNLLGRHNVYNALAAIAVGDYLGLDMQVIAEQLKSIQPADLRMQRIRIKDITLLADCYNANLRSVEAALSTITDVGKQKRKIMVFGDMKELGKFSVDHHRRIGQLVAEADLDVLIAVGKEASFAAKTAMRHGMNKNHVFECGSAQDASKILIPLLESEDIVLLKASRVMQLEKIIEDVKSDLN